jgi:hypothetical protein
MLFYTLFVGVGSKGRGLPPFFLEIIFNFTTSKIKIEMLLFIIGKSISNKQKQIKANQSNSRKMAQSSIEVYVGFITSLPEAGHLEYVINYTDDVPTEEEVKRIITQEALQFLGGQETDWIIIHQPNDENANQVYTFEWMNLNKEQMYPIMRSSTFRPWIHRRELNATGVHPAPFKTWTHNYNTSKFQCES